MIIEINYNDKDKVLKFLKENGINYEKANYLSDMLIKHDVEDMLDNGALDNAVTSDEALATYFLPIMTTAVMQNMPQGFILVHFPHVRVTNEHDRFVDINHL